MFVQFKKAISTGWTLVRALYTIAGCFIVIQSAVNSNWLALVFGSYFLLMGLLGFGCAGGACYSNQYSRVKAVKENEEPINFEEIK